MANSKLVTLQHLWQYYTDFFIDFLDWKQATQSSSRLLNPVPEPWLGMMNFSDDELYSGA